MSNTVRIRPSYRDDAEARVCVIIIKASNLITLPFGHDWTNNIFLRYGNFELIDHLDLSRVFTAYYPRPTFFIKRLQDITLKHKIWIKTGLSPGINCSISVFGKQATKLDRLRYIDPCELAKSRAMKVEIKFQDVFCRCLILGHYYRRRTTKDPALTNKKNP